MLDPRKERQAKESLGCLFAIFKFLFFILPLFIARYTLCPLAKVGLYEVGFFSRVLAVIFCNIGFIYALSIPISLVWLAQPPPGSSFGERLFVFFFYLLGSPAFYSLAIYLLRRGYRKRTGKEPERAFWQNIVEKIMIKILKRKPKISELPLGAWVIGNFAKNNKLFALPEKERRTHVYVLGASETGKTKLLEGWIRNDINSGQGIGVIDLHGDLINHILEWFYYTKDDPDLKNLILLDPTEKDYTVSFNPLEVPKGKEIDSVVRELVFVFKKIWRDAWGARMESILRNTLYALVEAKETMLEMPYFLNNTNNFRDKILSKITNEKVKYYWQEQFNSLPKAEQRIWIESTLNKVDAFISDKSIERIIGQKKSQIDFREIMDNRKWLLINLAEGEIGKDNAYLLGALIVAKIQMAAMSRIDIIDEEKRVPFYLYIDEFQNLATENFCDILAEIRKFRLSVILSHQSLSQLLKIEPALVDIILQNVSNQIYFRLDRDEAIKIAKQIFEVTGEEIKYLPEEEEGEFTLGEIWQIWRGTKKPGRPVFKSIAEEWEEHYKELENLQKREFWFHKRGVGTDKFISCFIETPPVTEQELIRFKKGFLSDIGRPTQEIDREIEERRREIIEPKEKVKEEPKDYWAKDIT
jgi:hypothetical protein